MALWSKIFLLYLCLLSAQNSMALSFEESRNRFHAAEVLDSHQPQQAFPAWLTLLEDKSVSTGFRFMAAERLFRYDKDYLVEKQPYQEKAFQALLAIAGDGVTSLTQEKDGTAYYKFQADRHHAAIKVLEGGTPEQCLRIAVLLMTSPEIGSDWSHITVEPQPLLDILLPRGHAIRCLCHREDIEGLIVSLSKEKDRAQWSKMVEETLADRDAIEKRRPHRHPYQSPL